MESSSGSKHKSRVEDKEANIGYSLDMNTFEGTLKKSKTKIISRPCQDRQQYLRAVEISHTNHSKCHFYDSPYMIYNRFNETASERFGKVFKDPVGRLNLKDINGERVTVISYLEPIYRQAIKLIVRFIVDIHKKQMALTKFTLANIVYERECLKFIGVGFRDGGYVNWKEDMECLHDLVKEIFQNRSFPRELDVWCALIPHLNYNNYYAGELLLYHLALLSPRESLAFFVACNERPPLLLRYDRSKYDNTINQMAACEGWNQRFFRESVLLPTDKCFLEKEKEPYTCKIGDGKRAVDVKKSMLRCVRNLTVHVQQHVHHTDKPLYEIGVERLVMRVFGEDLFKLQKTMAGTRCLESFAVINSI